MTAPLSVGLAGAGPWARAVHGPVLAAGPETRLVGVWSRTPERAAALAAELGVPAVERFDDLVERSEAVAFAVTPEAQPTLVAAAARRGRAVLVEKPLGADLAGARLLADAVAESGVGNLVGLTYRFAPAVRSFLAAVDAVGPVAGRACFLSGAYLADSPYHGSTWRRERGAVFDVGPHVLDVMEAALGPVVELSAHGNHAWQGLLLGHAGGAVSEVSISCSVAIRPSRTEFEVFGTGGSVRCDGRADDRSVIFAALRAAFADVARTRAPHVCGVARGLELQVLVDRAERALRTDA